MIEQPKATIDHAGSKFWKLIDKTMHREDGPAIEWAYGGKEWWLHGKRHREDGPAVERADGTKEWWFNGELIYKDTTKEKEQDKNVTPK